MKTRQTRLVRFCSASFTTATLVWQVAAQFPPPTPIIAEELVDLDGDRQAEMRLLIAVVADPFGGVVSSSYRFHSLVPEQVTFLDDTPFPAGGAMPADAASVTDATTQSGFYFVRKNDPDGVRYGWVEVEARESAGPLEVHIRRYVLDPLPGRAVTAGVLPDGVLHVEPGAAGLSLSWPTVGFGFQLQQAAGPVGGSWSFVADSEIHGRTLTLSVDSEARFYRLFRN